jgi:hypothetical protein
VVIGFDPEDRELIRAMLDQQDSEAAIRAAEGQRDAALRREETARGRYLAMEDNIGELLTRNRQQAALLETARSAAKAALLPMAGPHQRLDALTLIAQL